MLDKKLYEETKPHLIFSSDAIFKSWQRGREKTVSNRVFNHEKVLQDVATGKSDLLGRFYAERAEEKLLEIDLIKASMANDLKLFTLAQEKLYGEFDTSLVVRAAKSLQGLFENLEITTVEERYFCEVLSTLVFGDDKVPGDKVKIIPPGKLLSANQVAELFSEALEINYPDWQVVMMSDRRLISVKSHRKKILIPSQRRYRLEKVQALINHEINVHVRRAENASRSNIGLLQLGFKGYKTAEEGLAKHAELDYLPQSIIDSWKWYLFTYVAWQTMTNVESYDVEMFATGYLSLRKRLDKPGLNIAKSLGRVSSIMRRGSFSNDSFWVGNKRYYDGICLVEKFAKNQSVDINDMPEIWSGRFDFSNQSQLNFIKENLSN